ncbi:hypothetical protein [Acinetobacter modestus]|uniref:hypothetical protein n=1 Tax=Acinetobacter modestus TaxID=1776740 RepID=UPI001F4ACA1E|nr:hypothetical protein [Acinetobacter modestus]MCH7330286.1 hypothetical protein [Acinetobacter modestus]
MDINKIGLVLFSIIGIMASCYLNKFSEAVKKESEQRNLLGVKYFSKAKIKGKVKEINFIEDREIYAYNIMVIGDVNNMLKINPTYLFVYYDKGDNMKMLTIYLSSSLNVKAGQTICKGENSLYFYSC